MVTKLESMTGFGAARGATSSGQIEVEIKTLNHRYFDLAIRMPEHYNDLEMQIREILQGALGRGRIELSVKQVGLSSAAGGVDGIDLARFDTLVDSFAVMYARAKKRVASRINEQQIGELVLSLINRKDLQLSEGASNVSTKDKSVVLRTVEKAVAAVRQSRRQEGAHLAKDMLKRVRELTKFKRTIVQESVKEAARRKALISEKVKAALASTNYDQERLMHEIVALVERADIAEELSRIDGHIKALIECLGQMPAGRKIDFLLQELNREFNTTSSKVSSCQAAVVEGKLVLEKLREQGQNVI